MKLLDKNKQTKKQNSAYKIIHSTQEFTFLSSLESVAEYPLLVTSEAEFWFKSQMLFFFLFFGFNNGHSLWR